MEYKIVNGMFKMSKVLQCVIGIQQEQGVHFQLGELYTPVSKDAEMLLFITLTAKHQLKIYKSDTKQEFLNGNMGEEKIYVCQPD